MYYCSKRVICLPKASVYVTEYEEYNFMYFFLSAPSIEKGIPFMIEIKTFAMLGIKLTPAFHLY